MQKNQTTEWATIGQVVALFGVRGELKVRLLTDIPDRFAGLKNVRLGPEHRRFAVEHTRPYKGEMIVLKLVGVDDPNTAEPLCRLEIQIPADQLAPLPPGSYYQHDILGLTVFTLENRELGQIVDILETGSNDVYTIKGSDGKQVLIPAIKDVVKQIDLLRRTMYIDPLPGLLDPPTREDHESMDDEQSSAGVEQEQGTEEGHF